MTDRNGRPDVLRPQKDELRGLHGIATFRPSPGNLSHLKIADDGEVTRRRWPQLIIFANETKRTGGDYEIGRSVRLCVCLSVYTITAQAATPAITLTSLPCSEAALSSASPFGRNGGALL